LAWLNAKPQAVNPEESTMTIATPDWLTQHGGELKASQDGRSWSVYLGGKLQYVLNLTPAGGKNACRVAQTVNAKRLDKGRLFDSPEAAAKGGLEDLRIALGW
jgi:hypothetical protein